jgi:hypothetical protein
MVMNLGDSGGTAKGWETTGVVLNARHGEDDVAALVDVKMRHEERADCRPHIDGRESEGGIFFDWWDAILPTGRQNRLLDCDVRV